MYNSSHNLIINLRTYGTASLSHELLLIIAFGELLIKKVHVRFIFLKFMNSSGEEAHQVKKGTNQGYHPAEFFTEHTQRTVNSCFD
jgi:hypothetical protein